MIHISKLPRALPLLLAAALVPAASALVEESVECFQDPYPPIHDGTEDCSELVHPGELRHEFEALAEWTSVDGTLKLRAKARAQTYLLPKLVNNRFVRTRIAAKARVLLGVQTTGPLRLGWIDAKVEGLHHGYYFGGGSENDFSVGPYDGWWTFGRFQSFCRGEIPYIPVTGEYECKAKLPVMLGQEFKVESRVLVDVTPDDYDPQQWAISEALLEFQLYEADGVTPVDFAINDREDLDNCPDVDNPEQEDADGDFRGDACDPCTAVILGEYDSSEDELRLEYAFGANAPGGLFSSIFTAEVQWPLQRTIIPAVLPAETRSVSFPLEPIGWTAVALLLSDGSPERTCFDLATFDTSGVGPNATEAAGAAAEAINQALSRR